MSKPDLTKLFDRHLTPDVNRTRTSIDVDRTMPMRVACRTGGGTVADVAYGGTTSGVRVGESRERTHVVIDVSGSMAGDFEGARSKIEAAGLAAQAFIVEKARIDEHDEVGLIVFNRRAELVVLRKGKRALLQAVPGLNADGWTNIRRALDMAESQMVFDGSATERIVLLSDGYGGDFADAAEALKARGVVIDCVGIGESRSDVDEAQLKRAASIVEGTLRYEFATDMRQLTGTFTSIGAKTVVQA